jgi:hypothetical protein
MRHFAGLAFQRCMKFSRCCGLEAGTGSSSWLLPALLAAHSVYDSGCCPAAFGCRPLPLPYGYSIKLFTGIVKHYLRKLFHKIFTGITSKFVHYYILS